MAQEINLGGAIYVSSKRAAEITGYAQDYIGQLARSGQIEGRRVAGMWYVLEESVRKHKEGRDVVVLSEAPVTHEMPTEPTPEPVTPVKSVEEPTESTPLIDENNLESEITYEGKGYISATRASRITGYSHDYVTQLARGEKVPGHQIGNRWYVEREGILAHKNEKDALLAAVQAESVGISRVPDGFVSSSHTVERHEPAQHFTYQEDSSALFPRLQEKEMTRQEEFSGYEKNNSVEDTINQIQIRVIPEERKYVANEPAIALRTSINAYLSGPKAIMFFLVFIGITASGIGGFAYLQHSPKNAVPVPGVITNESVAAASMSGASMHLAAIAETLFSKELKYSRQP